MHPIHLAGHPAEAAATHAAATHAAHAHATGPAPHTAAHVIAAVDAAGTAHAAACLEGIEPRTRIDREHEVGHGIDLDDQILLGLLLGGDQEHLVLDDVGQVNVSQHSTERCAEADCRGVLGDWRVEIEARILERPRVDLDRDAEFIGDRPLHVSQGRLVELPPAHRLFEGLVDLLFLAARVCQIDRLVLLPQPRDLPPAVGARIDDRRLVHEGDRRDVHEVERVHEAPLLIAAGAVVLGVVLQDPGHQRRRPADNPGRHRDRTVRVELRRLTGDLLAGHPLRFDKCPRGEVGADHGLAIDHRGVVLRLGVADADALLDEGVVFLGELLDLLLASLQVGCHLHPFPADRRPSLGGEVAVGLLPRPNDRLTNPHFELSGQPRCSASVQVVRPADFLLQLLEFLAGLIRVGREQLPGLTDADGRVLLLLLGPDATLRVELKQFVIAGRSGGKRRRRRLGERLGHADLTPSRLADDRRFLVIGVATERRLRQPDCGGVGTGGLGLDGECRKRGRLAEHHLASQSQALPADNGQEEPIAAPGIAGEFGEIRVFQRWCDGRDRERDRPPRARLAQREFELPVLKAAFDEHDRITVCPQRGQPRREHPEFAGFPTSRESYFHRP